MRAYFTLKLGWSKTNAGTNIGPQNDMYLSAPGQDCQAMFTLYRIGFPVWTEALSVMQFATLPFDLKR